MSNYTSFKTICQDIAEGKTTCVKLVESYLKQIKEKSHLNAFLEVYDQEALAQASLVDQKLKEGKAGKLAGMVIGLKDVLCHKGHGLQASSKILEGFISQFDGTVVQRLIDEDAIIIGRQNCDEFAMGSSCENSAFGPTLNADNENRVPGGSSGGSAVAVQADMCLVSLGSDTGGSVRQPASFCGIAGLKPTYGRVSRHGLLAYASSFDVIGVFAKEIEDMALVLEVIAGPDEFDSTVLDAPVPNYSERLELKGKQRIAYLKQTIETEGISSEVKSSFLNTIEKLKGEGHEIEEIEFPLLDYVLPTYYILTTAEASSNLSRFDGVKYGHRSTEADSLESMYKLSRDEGFGEEVKQRILLGTFVLSANYYDAYYIKAQRVRRMIRDATMEILSDHDFIISPTSPTTAFKIGEHTANPLEMYLADLFTVQASVSGIPAISVPQDRDSDGMSIGVQLMANHYKEDSILAFSKYLLSLN